MPAIIYNVPAMAGVNFSTDDLYTLLSEPGIAGIKQTSMNLFQTEQLVRAFSEKSVINGHDEIFLSALAVGVRACIGSTVTFMPNMFVELKRRFDVGDHTGALELQGRINNIVRVLQNIGVFKGVKAALDILDINVGICRAPFEPLNPIELNQLETVLRENL